MTLVVVLGAIVVVGILSALSDPMQQWIQEQWQGISDETRVNP